MAVRVMEIDAGLAARRATKHPDPRTVRREDPCIAAAALPQVTVLPEHPEQLPGLLWIVHLNERRIGLLFLAQPLDQAVAGDSEVVLPDDVHPLVDLLGRDHAA